ncbi:MAG: sortase [Patescibacteria group bacterium]
MKKDLISNVFYLMGILFLFFSLLLIIQRYNPNRLAFQNNPGTDSRSCKNIQKIPRVVRIPDLGIELPIILSDVKDGKWEVSTKGVSYLTQSPAPGEKGNSILYGHNWSQLLGPLVSAKPGYRIEVEFNNGEKNMFRIDGVSVVTPKNTSVLKSTSSSRRITLYTCTGFMDLKRFVVTGTLEDVI